MEAAEPGTEQNALMLETDDEGIAWLTFDRPDSPVNLLTTPVMQRLDALLSDVEEGARAGRIRALVVRSGKSGNFIAGADVDEIAGITDPEDGAAKAREGQRVLHGLERLPVPTVAAIDGICLGGGTELALACSTRVASDRRETKIGLPEVKLGIVPGFGGTVRLPRLIGLQAALRMIVSGRTSSPRRAERSGLIDERVAPATLEDRARALARERIDGREGAGGGRGLTTRLLDETRLGRRVVFWRARRQTLEETKGHYPAPLAAIDTIRESLRLPPEEAFQREAETLGELAVTDTCKHLIHVFRLMEDAKKSDLEAEPRPVDHAAVVGAGVMGGGIAQLLAYRGPGVRLKDIQPDALSSGLRHARRLFDKLVRKHRLDRLEADQRMDRIAPTLDYSGFGAADLVIEAVVERMDVKREVLAEVEDQTGPDCVLTSNTSALSITELQRALERPENFCGMHFFNPVHKMPLIEIVRGADTAEEALATVFALARRLGKTPLVVNDGPGFLVNRLLGPYLNEAGWLLVDGASIESIDGALLDFGMPMGPLRLLDEVGLDVAQHASGVLHDAFGQRMRPAPPLVALEDTDRLGKKGGRGFYRYEDGEEQEPDDSVYEELGSSVPGARREIPARTIRERTVFAMINEAARVLEAGIVERAGAVDLGLITGTGFPPFRGGLLRYADAVGPPAILEALERFERELGPRFEPAPLLRQYAEADRGFYD